MHRPRVSRALAVGVFSWATVSGAAELAVLKSSDAPAWRPTIEALRRVATAHSVTEYDLRGDRAEADRVLGGLKGRSVVLIVMGPLAAQAARETMPEAPLVFCMIQDPARLGLQVAPGLTGVSFGIPIKNQLAAFRMVNPRAVRIGVIYNPDVTGKLVQEASKAAGVVRLALVERPIGSEREVPQALRELLKGATAVDALWVPPDPTLLGEESRRFILAETLKSGKPVYGFSSSLVVEGALVSNGPDFGSIGEHLGDLANRLASGDKTKVELLVPRAELVINRKIGDKLKIDIPPEAIKAASRVY